MQLRHRRLKQSLDEFMKRRDYRSYRRMIRLSDGCIGEGGVPKELATGLQAAVLLAAASPDWRLAQRAISDLCYEVRGAFGRRADIIAGGLLSRYKSVRQSSWVAVGGPRLARMVLSRLEAKPIEEVMVWEVLMAVDWMAHDLTAEKDRQRMVQFVKRMEQRGTRSGLLAFKIDDTVYCDLHLGQPREEESTCGAR
jgi:hypothetical protein